MTPEQRKVFARMLAEREAKLAEPARSSCFAADIERAQEIVALRALLAESAAPREPTEAMLVAARDWSNRVYGKPIGNEAARGCWLAMVAAAPDSAPPDDPYKRVFGIDSTQPAAQPDTRGEAREVLQRFAREPYKLHLRADDAGALWRAMMAVTPQALPPQHGRPVGPNEEPCYCEQCYAVVRVDGVPYTPGSDGFYRAAAPQGEATTPPREES